MSESFDPEQRVIVESMVGGDDGELGPWYHDAEAYTSEFPGDTEMSRGEAEERGFGPCPQCFPDGELGDAYVTRQVELPNGDVVTETVLKGIAEREDDERAELTDEDEARIDDMRDALDATRNSTPGDFLDGPEEDDEE